MNIPPSMRALPFKERTKAAVAGLPGLLPGIRATHNGRVVTLRHATARAS